MDFIKDLQWREMIHDMTPETEAQLKKEMTSAYIGFDPTSDSLHVGSFAQIMLLKRFQMAGHKPIVLVGGATGMIGDPSGKSQERNLLDEKTLNHNLNGIKNQLSKFLDFDSSKPNCAEIVNNYDWMKDYNFLHFIRDIGKHITVNYMMAKDSVKKRIGADSTQGMSFTEFSYQLVQGYDFYWLYKNKNCKLQMGGSDQWGNILTGTELIRRKDQGEAHALTIPLITKSDGGKFGKTEEGNIWLDKRYTSPYKFYQFWLNVSDEDAQKYIKVFTMLDKDEINDLIDEHSKAPHTRVLQKKLAQEITIMAHSQEDYELSVEASNILFGNATSNTLKKIDEATFLSVFDGVPKAEISKSELKNGINIIDILASKTEFLKSNGEARRALAENSISINKEKISDPAANIDSSYLINGKYMILQKGKKNYFLISFI